MMTLKKKEEPNDAHGWAPCNMHTGGLGKSCFVVWVPVDDTIQNQRQETDLKDYFARFGIQK